jgi:parallel beta-helix repeat protein
MWDVFSDSTISSNFDHGVVLTNCSDNSFVGNSVNLSGSYGVYLSNSTNNTFSDSEIADNTRAFYLVASGSNTLLNNTVKDNREYGFMLSYSGGNKISENEISNSGTGVHLATSDGNIVSGNEIVSNGISGIFVGSISNNNVIFDNYFNNFFNTNVKNGSFGNVWNTTKTSGTNIVNGPNIGGNFWAKPDGTGFSQTATDADGDGIADLVYNLEGNTYTDFLPLVGDSEPEMSVSPVELNNSETKTDMNETDINEIGTNETVANETEISTNETTPDMDEDTADTSV